MAGGPTTLESFGTQLDITVSVETREKDSKSERITLCRFKSLESSAAISLRFPMRHCEMRMIDDYPILGVTVAL